MAKQHLLLVDGDPQSLRLMEVSLRKAGFVTSTAVDGAEALARLETFRPALIIADADVPGLDGYELCVHLKTDARFADIPFILLADEASPDARIRGLELGADDALTRPIYTRELITRVRMALEREKRRSLSSQHRFFGDLADMSVIDLLQTLDVGGKSGRARITSEGRQGTVWFDTGRVADAEAGGLTGAEAIYRLLTWDAGTFEMDFRGTPRARTVDASTQALLMEGVRRMDEWSRVAEQLPALDGVLHVDRAEFEERLDELPSGSQGVLRLFDGVRSIRAVVDEVSLPDLEALRLISRLYFEGILQVSPAGSAAQRRSLPPALPNELPSELLEVEPDWMEDSDPPGRLAEPLEGAPTPVTEPPPRVTGTVPRLEVAAESRRPRGLVDDLIRSAVHLPVAGEPTPAPAEVAPRAERVTPRVERITPRAEASEPPRITADLTRQAAAALANVRQAEEHADQRAAQARARLAEARLAEARIAEARIAEARIAEARITEARTAETRLADARAAEARGVEARGAEARQAELRLAELRLAEAQAAEARLAEARVAEAWAPRPPTPAVAPAPPPPAAVGPPERLAVPLEDDLLQPGGSNRRAAMVAGFFVLAIVAAGVAWLLRDTVQPFAGKVTEPRLGWHKGILSELPPVQGMRPAPGDWHLPSRTPGAAEAPAGEAPAMDAPATDAPATDAAAPATELAAPGSTAPGAAAPAGEAMAAAPDTDAAPAGPAGSEFDRLLATGMGQHQKGRYDQAAATLGKAVKLRPESVDARLALARARLEAGGYDAALAEARQVIQRKPDSARAWLIAGTVHQLKGNRKEAAEAYQRCLTLDPSGPSAGELRSILPTLQ